MEEARKSWSGAYTCMFNDDLSEMLLLWRNKEKREKEIVGWGNIGGSMEPGETALQTCIREAKEEIGIELKPEDLTFICTKASPGEAPHSWTIYFYAASIDGNTEINLNDESRGYAWFGANELPAGTLDSKEDILNWWSLAKNALHKGDKINLQD
ncbi:MAG: NUDIX hydrolase [Candidatus Marsarchaeota archaeon]|jgi:8-oxo-dGTP pyrophosphatase MutT (NUDIX family)|nr:NUDIX hydrolase [Candidatus Marsarchaeota archaeon]